MIDIPLPPPQFDHPYRGYLIEWRVPLSEVPRLCPGIVVGKSGTLYGCSIHFPPFGGEQCVIVVATNLAPKDIERTRRHEIAHCNGWSAEHSAL